MNPVTSAVCGPREAREAALFPEEVYVSLIRFPKFYEKRVPSHQGRHSFLLIYARLLLSEI
jgi:hypothetical protein